MAATRIKKPKRISVDTVPDAYSIWEAGMPFLGASSFLWDVAIEESFTSHMFFPSVIFASFAAELLLKCLSHSKVGSFKKSHLLKELFEDLDDEEQDALTCYASKTVAIDPLPALLEGKTGAT